MRNLLYKGCRLWGKASVSTNHRYRTSSYNDGDMAFLAQLAASEDLTYHRSYSKEFVYADLYNERPTKITCTNSDLGFSGEIALRSCGHDKSCGEISPV